MKKKKIDLDLDALILQKDFLETGIKAIDYPPLVNSWLKSLVGVEKEIKKLKNKK